MRRDNIDRNTCINGSNHMHKSFCVLFGDKKENFEVKWCYKCGSILFEDTFTVPDEAKDDWHKDSLMSHIASLQSDLAHSRKMRLIDYEEKLIYSREVIRLNNSLKKRSRARKFYIKYVRRLEAFINDWEYTKGVKEMVKKELKEAEDKE